MLAWAEGLMRAASWQVRRTTLNLRRSEERMILSKSPKVTRSTFRWVRPAVGGRARSRDLASRQRPVPRRVGALDGQALAAAAAIFLVTTVCFAWRWKTVADGLGVRLSLADAVAAYYRCLFLNLTLPGGVAGDVHRGVRHGRGGDVGHALRAVVWERAAGQVVQVLLTIAVLLSCRRRCARRCRSSRSHWPRRRWSSLSSSARERDAGIPGWSGRGTRRWRTSADVF